MAKNTSKLYKNFHLNNFNVDIGLKENRIILIVIVLLVIILVFRKVFGSILERIIVFSIIFLLFLIISKNLIITLISSCIIFLLINLLMRYRDTVENFEDLKEEIDKEPNFDLNVFNKADVKDAAKNIEEFVKKMNGGIELKPEDTVETPILNKDLTKHKNDEENNHPLKQAQKETFELINTVNALKDTITTLTPVLQEGKKLMDIFQTIKI